MEKIIRLTGREISMFAKAQEKSLDLLFPALTSAIGLILVRLFFKNASPETAQDLAPYTELIACGILLAPPWVASRFKSWRFKPGVTLQPQGIVRPEGYLLPALHVAVYGTLLFTAGSLLLSVLAGFSQGIFLAGTEIAQDQELFIQASVTALLFGQGIAAYLVGRWIGTRTAKRSLLAIILVILFGRMILFAIDNLFLYELTIDFEVVAYFLLLSLPIWVCGVLGCWRGVKAREAGYLWYLMDNLPPTTREPIESLIFEEVQARVQAEAGGNAAVASPAQAG
jgi:hypothetical protein